MTEYPKSLVADEITKVAVSIIVRKDNKILLGKRLTSVGYGTWGLPGGHLEFDESIEAAAHRELMEETGLIAKLRLINITNDRRGEVNRQHYIHFVFEASEVEGEPQDTEPDRCEHWEWFDIAKLPENIFFANAKVLKAVEENKFFVD